MKKEHYIALEKKKDFLLEDIYATLKNMYAIPSGWDARWVARLNDKIFQHNLFVRKYKPTKKECELLLIKIILLGSNS